MDDHAFIPLEWTERSGEEMLALAEANYAELSKRRTTRYFSRDADRRLIELAILSGSTAPTALTFNRGLGSPSAAMRCRRNCVKPLRPRSGKRQRAHARSVVGSAGAARHGRRQSLPHGRALGGRAVQAKKRQRNNGKWGPTYYTVESCGIAAGMLIQAVHNMGLATLTHTPSPMGFLRELLERPKHEEAMLVMPVGISLRVLKPRHSPKNAG